MAESPKLWLWKRSNRRILLLTGGSCCCCVLLVTVNIIHDFAHKARSFFNGIHLATCNVEGYPYASECSHLDYFFRLPEAGYMAERALFGGIVGVVFQDEIEGERPPFFDIRYDKISYFYLQCAEDSAYRLGAWSYIYH
jgi:hypothetical protein